MDELKSVKQGWTITIGMLAFWGLLSWYWGSTFVAGFFAGCVLYSLINA